MGIIYRSMMVASILALAGWALTPERVLGWSQGGHRVVANIAYDRIDADKRAQIVAVLRQHDDFALRFDKMMPADIRNGSVENQDRWIFLQAAIWPDLIRNIPKFHREPWHFTDFPFFPLDGDEAALKGSVTPNLNENLPGVVTASNQLEFNCIQAFKYARGQVIDSHNSPGQRAIFISWIIHIAGDSHQPLHSINMYTRARFNDTQGDRGGHVPIVPVGKNPKHRARDLHTYWDGLHGEMQAESDALEQIVTRSKNILDNADNKNAAEKAAKTPNIKDWLLESTKIAKEFAYSPAIIKMVRDGEHSVLVPTALSDEYQQTAQQIADRRVAEAGYRLAAFLNQLN